MSGDNVIPRNDKAGIGWRCTRCNAAWSGAREHTCRPERVSR